MLIGLNGKLQSGKDTTYQIIRDLHPEAEQVSFAKKLKESAAAAIGTTVEELERLKVQEEINLTTIPHSNIKPFNIREYLQWYGTEAHRDIFGSDFWVDMALPCDIDHTGRILVVTDMRFENEIQRVKDLGGLTVKLNRTVSTKHGSHASEQDFDYMIDYFLDNTGTLLDLRHNISKMIESLEVSV